MNFAGIIRLNKFGITVLVSLFLLLMLYMFTRNLGADQIENVVNLRKLLIAAIEVAEKGGREVSEVHNLPDMNVRSKGKTQEGANELLTMADKKSHCVMYFGLTRAFPKIKVISEEEASKDCNQIQLVDLDSRALDGQVDLVDENVPAEDVTVWIDPLDATQEFTENLLQYVTTMVCVAVRGKPIIGVIHKPFGEEPKTSWSWFGRATSSDLKKSKKVDDLTVSPTIIVSRSHAGKVEDLAKKTFAENLKVVPAGGAGYKVLEVIAGNATAYIHTTNIKKWDICAGNAIINAVGGHMTTLQNELIDYSATENAVNSHGLVSTVGSKHESFVQKLSHFKE